GDLQQFEPVGAHCHNSVSFLMGLSAMRGLVPSMSFFPSCSFYFSLRGLLAPQGLRHQFVREHELGFAHFVDWQQYVLRLACVSIVAPQAGGIASGAVER